MIAIALAGVALGVAVSLLTCSATPLQTTATRLSATPLTASLPSATAARRAQRWWLHAGSLPLGVGKAVRRRLPTRAHRGIAVAVAVATAMVALGPGWALLLTAAGSAVVGTCVGQAERYEQQRTERAVAQACASLAGQVQVGVLPSQALVEAARESPEIAALLGPAVRAQRWAAPVAPALAQVATQPGAHAMAVVAACWQLTHQHGASLAPGLQRVHHLLADQQALRRETHTLVAAPLATAWVLMGLPVLPLVLGHLAGANPLGVLVNSQLGMLCLVLGVGLSATGLWVIRRLCQGVHSQLHDAPTAQCQTLAYALAACLSTGATLPAALQASVSMVGDSALRRAVQQCVLMRQWGADPQQACAALLERENTTELAHLLRRCLQSGVQAAEAATAHAQRLQAEQRELVRQHAQVLPVKMAGVLGVCFLPAFFLLGIVPLVVGMGAVVLPALTR